MNILANMGVPPETAVFFALPLLGCFLLLIAAFAGGKNDRLYKQRLAKVRGASPRAAQSHARAGPVSVKRTTQDSSIPVLDRLIKSALPRREQLSRRLQQAGLSISIGNYLAICSLVAVAIALPLLLSGLLPGPAAALLGLTGGLTLPHGATYILGKRRQAKFLGNFPEAIDLMTRGLKSGLPIIESIKTAGSEVPNPVGEELRQVSDAVRLGTKLEDALMETSERIGLQEFKFFTISLSIQAETGGNLTETLNNLSDVLRKRRQLKLKIKALSSEAKASAYIIGSLPFVMAGVIYMLNPGYVMELIIDPRGHVLIGLGLFSFFVGAAVMFKMIRFDY